MAPSTEDALARYRYLELLGRLDRIEARIADCHKASHVLRAIHRQIVDAIAEREARMALETPCPGLLACLLETSRV